MSWNLMDPSKGDEDDLNAEGTLSCQKSVFMKYVSVIQKENHSITCLDLKPDDNWFVK